MISAPGHTRINDTDDVMDVLQQLLLRLQAEQVEVGRSEEFQRLAQILINNMYLQRQQVGRPLSSSSSVGACIILCFHLEFGLQSIPYQVENCSLL